MVEWIGGKIPWKDPGCRGWWSWRAAHPLWATNSSESNLEFHSAWVRWFPRADLSWQWLTLLPLERCFPSQNWPQTWQCECSIPPFCLKQLLMWNFPAQLESFTADSRHLFSLRQGVRMLARVVTAQFLIVGLPCGYTISNSEPTNAGILAILSVLSVYSSYIYRESAPYLYGWLLPVAGSLEDTHLLSFWSKICIF